MDLVDEATSKVTEAGPICSFDLSAISELAREFERIVNENPLITGLVAQLANDEATHLGTLAWDSINATIVFKPGDL